MINVFGFSAIGHCLIFAEWQALLFFSLFAKLKTSAAKIPQNYFIQNLQEITKDKNTQSHHHKNNKNDKNDKNNKRQKYQKSSSSEAKLLISGKNNKNIKNDKNYKRQKHPKS